MDELVGRGINIKLLAITYKVGKSSKHDIDVKDSYQVEKITENAIHLIFERNIILNFERKETLNIKVSVIRPAEEGINLLDSINEEYIESNIENLLGPTISFVSLLVSQITGAFGDCPFITAPTFYSEELDSDDKKDE